MKTINLEQGTDAWLAHRAITLNASDAPAMMGVSPYTSRQELMRYLTACEEREIPPGLQRVFDDGHRVEAATKPIAEEIVGDELFSATVADDDGWLGASLDGITMDERVIWECKQASQEKLALADDGTVRKDDMIQVQQQLLITGAEKCLYTVGDGTREGTRSVWVEPDPEIQKRIVAGWRQFETDLANYDPPDDAPEAVANPVGSLPALTIQVEGKVLASNLDVYRDRALAVFAGINTDLTTDQDFADAEETVKWCGEVEKKLDAAKEHALGQTASLDELFKAIDDIKATARQKRLELDKLVKHRKQQVRDEIRSAAHRSLVDHVDSLQQRTHPVPMPMVSADFAGAMKNKRTIQSLRDSVDQVLTDAKLEANAVADRIDANLRVYRELVGDRGRLFPDLNNLAQKAPEDFTASVKMRLAEDDKAQAERERQKSDAERGIEERRARHEAEEQSRRDAGKCDGNHGAPTCDDPECWQKPEPSKTDTGVCTKQVTLVATFATVVDESRSDEEIRAALEQRLRAAGFQTLQSVEARSNKEAA